MNSGSNGGPHPGAVGGFGGGGGGSEDNGASGGGGGYSGGGSGTHPNQAGGGGVRIVVVRVVLALLEGMQRMTVLSKLSSYPTNPKYYTIKPV